MKKEGWCCFLRWETWIPTTKSKTELSWLVGSDTRHGKTVLRLPTKVENRR